MATTRTLSALAVVFLFLSVACAKADSTIVEHLATVEDLGLRVIVPQFQPIPDFSPSALKEKIRAKATALIEEGGLSLTESSSEVVQIFIEYQDGGQKSGVSAIVVRTEFIEPAHLEREWEGVGAPSLQVTSWMESRLVVCRHDELGERLFEAVENALRHFVGEVKAAKGYLRRSKS